VERPLLFRLGRGAVLAALGAILLTRAAWLPHTLGLALVIVALGEALPALVRLYPFASGEIAIRRVRIDIEKVLRAVLPPLALFVVTCGLLWPCVRGQMPTWQDHPVHLTKAWYFYQHLFKRGRIDGWMDYWFYGQPAETLYPPLSDYWLSFVKLLTLGLASWERVYAWGFVLMYFICALSVYKVTARFCGRAGGVIAGLLFLLDRGEYREGGWQYAVYWGVWPQIFATAFLFLSFGKAVDVVERGRRRDYVLCAALVALALLGHPTNLIVYVLAVPAFLVARLATDPGRPGVLIVRLLVPLGLGLALAAYWVLPFSASSTYAAQLGDVWTGKDVGTMAGQMFAGGLFQSMPLPVLLLAICGGVAGIIGRRFAPAFLSLLALGLLFAASTTAFDKLHLLDLSPSFGQVQYQRLSIPIKMAVFVLAAQGVVLLAEGARRLREAEPARAAAWSSAARRLPLMIGLALCVAPFVLPLVDSYRQSYEQGVGTLQTKAQLPDWAYYQQFLAWLREQRGPEMAEDGPNYFRVAFVAGHDEHFFSDEPVYADVPAYKVGFTPVSNFLYKPEDPDPALYKTLSVKYVVSRNGSGTPYPVERTFGDIVVQRFPDYDPARAHVDGGGAVDVHVDSPEHWTMQVSGTGPDSRLVVHTAYFPSWHLYQDGKELPIERVPASTATPSVSSGVSGIRDYDFLISAPVHDGTVELVYKRRAVDWLGDLVTLLALGICGLLLFGGTARIARLLDRLRPVWEVVERRGVAIGAGLVVLVGGVAVVRAAIKRHGVYILHEHFEPGPQNANVLVETVAANGLETPCTTVKDGQVLCSAADWNHVGDYADRFNGGFKPCLLAHPVGPGQKLLIHFLHVPVSSNMTLEDGLTDACVRQSPAGAPVTIDVSIDGTPVATDTRPNQLGWYEHDIDTSAFAGGDHEVDFSVESRDNVFRYFCFDAKLSRK
jgi:hypothetical protein